MAINAKATFLTLQQVETLTTTLTADLTAKINASNTIESIKVNGTALEITDKAVDITVPTKVSELTNDSSFVNQSWTETYVNQQIAAADHLSRKKVDTIEAIDPSAEGADKFIYMVPKTGAEGDSYDEYMVMDGKVERVGDWAVDLSGYVEKEAGKGLSTNDFTDADKTKLDGVAEGATKVTATEGSGTLNINGTDVELFRVATAEEFQAMLVRCGLATAV